MKTNRLQASWARGTSGTRNEVEINDSPSGRLQWQKDIWGRIVQVKLIPYVTPWG